MMPLPRTDYDPSEVAVSWRLLGSLDTFMLSFLVTGRLRYAVSIAGGEALTKIALYYVHERAWRRVAWGRLEDPAAARAAASPSPGAVLT